MQASRTVATERLLRAYEVLWIIYAVVATIVLLLTDFAFAAIVVFCLLGIALVFGGMMGVLPELAGHL